MGASLICTLLFQTHGETAPSQLILYHYTDLMEDKGIVLMTAELDTKFVVSPITFVQIFMTI